MVIIPSPRTSSGRQGKEVTGGFSRTSFRKVIVISLLSGHFLLKNDSSPLSYFFIETEEDTEALFWRTQTLMELVPPPPPHRQVRPLHNAWLHVTAVLYREHRLHLSGVHEWRLLHQNTSTPFAYGEMSSFLEKMNGGLHTRNSPRSRRMLASAFILLQ